MMRKALGAAFQPGSPTKVVGMSAKDGEDTELLEALIAQSKEHPDLTFMYADKTMDLFDRVKSHFGVEDNQLPAFIVNNDEGKWHSFTAEVSALAGFVTDFKAGKIEKTVKSAAIPSEPYEDDVRVRIADYMCLMLLYIIFVTVEGSRISRSIGLTIHCFAGGCG